MTKTIQLQKRGALTLPKKIRKRYQLRAGDAVTILDLDEGIFISPKPSALPKLVGQIEQIRRKNDISLAELIEGVRAQRNRRE